MDSGNSGSIQSSSAGDEEYDSRVDSIKDFGNLSNPPPHHHPNFTVFDPLPNYFDPDSLPNFDTMWAKSLIRPDSPNCTNGSLLLPFSGALFTSSSSSPTVPFETTQNDQIQTPVVRNRKKRSRASRRAPTTVLTTDTTNFRAMVQEFTGIPVPPFTSLSSPFPRTRLDLFGTGSATRSHPFSDGLQPPPYLLRPYAQKFQTPPFLSPNSNDVGSGNSSRSGSNSNSFTNFQMQSQMLTFQSPLGNSSILLSSGQGNDDVDQPVWGVGVGQNDGDQSHQLKSINGNFIE